MYLPTRKEISSVLYTQRIHMQGAEPAGSIHPELYGYAVVSERIAVVVIGRKYPGNWHFGKGTQVVLKALSTRFDNMEERKLSEMDSDHAKVPAIRFYTIITIIYIVNSWYY